jgi:PhnB protein
LQPNQENKPVTRTEIIPYIFYRDIPSALAWLTRAFGFKEAMRTGTQSGGMHAEMSLYGQRIMMGQGAKHWGMVSPREAAMATMGIFIYLDDVDGHHARAQAAGAEIVQAPHDQPYGRTYTARDLDGHPWFFTTPPK